MSILPPAAQQLILSNTPEFIARAREEVETQVRESAVTIKTGLIVLFWALLLWVLYEAVFVCRYLFYDWTGLRASTLLNLTRPPAAAAAQKKTK